MTEKPTYSSLQKLLAWGVHSFTASGLVAGFMAILAINENDWKKAMLWLIVALIIDGIDGSFARIVKVKQVLPHIDGKMIDYVVDFANYAIIPAYFFYTAGLVDPDWQLPCVIIILIVSALYYGLDGMVSTDMYFVGFPVLWNMVVFYQVFVFQFSPAGNAFFIVFFAVLHFVPIKFVYPSRTKRFRGLTIAVTILFFLTLAAILWVYPDRSIWLSSAAIGAIFYFGGMAIYNTWIET